MKQLFVIGFLVMLTACGSSDKTYHTVKVVKPIYHHTWYKNSRWHKKLQFKRIRIRLFEKQGVKKVRMKG